MSYAADTADDIATSLEVDERDALCVASLDIDAADVSPHRSC